MIYEVTCRQNIEADSPEAAAKKFRDGMETNTAFFVSVRQFKTPTRLAKEIVKLSVGFVINRSATRWIKVA